MTSESFFAVVVSSLIAMFFGFLVSFGGYRFFLVLLPVWGFVYGFGFGAQSVQAFLGGDFLATVTSWVIGLLIGAVFAVLSYLFYIFGVALIAASLGYALGVGVMMAIGFDFQFIDWMVGVILAVIFAIGAIVLNIQKYVVIVATSLLGAGIIVGTFLFIFGGLPSASLVQNPVRSVLESSPLWMILFLVVAALGIVSQIMTTRAWEIETYDRFSELTSGPSHTAPTP
jgi:hypothetical protein